MRTPSSTFQLPEGYRLAEAFSDEFDAPTLDLRKWRDFCPEWAGRAPALFDRRNISIRDSALCLTARKIPVSEVPPYFQVRGLTPYITAFVSSRERILYGYFETRFRAMRACVCNAFWLNDPLPHEEKWKAGEFSEEIDMFEVFGKRAPADTKKNPDCANTYFCTTHRVPTPYVEMVLHGNPIQSKAATPVLPHDFFSDWHVGAFLWTPETLTWILDGVVMDTRPNEHFHRAMYLNIDCEIMRTWVGLPEDEDLPSTFRLDYVRTFTKTPSN